MKEGEEKPTTLVVYCSTYLFQQAFHRFIEETLGIALYDAIAVPGGAQFLVARDYLPKFGWAGSRWTAFLLQSHGLSRVVLIAHAGCQWYQHVHGHHADFELLHRSDLRQAGDELQRIMPGVAVESYIARLKDGQAVFERVDAAAGT